MSRKHCSPKTVLSAFVILLSLLFVKPALAMEDPVPAAVADTSLLDLAVSHANDVFEDIKKKSHFINALSSEDMGTLPVGIVREINGRIYVIAIDSAKLTPTGATFNAYFKFTFPGTKTELIFGAKNVAFTPGGIAASASTKLVLLNTKSIPINSHIDLIFPGDGSNYIEWDCNGFKAANLAGIFEFDKSWISPDDAAADKLRASMKVTVNDLNNIMATVDIPAFHINNLSDFSFKVKNATVDLSDVANPAGMTVTADMLEDASSPLLWRGFYLQEVQVGLPQQLATAKGRPMVTVKNFYIDDQGISGSLSAANLVPLGEASLGGWGISVDKLGLSFSKNKLNGGELGGLMEIGFLGKDPLGYNASVSMRGSDTYYSFGVNTTVDKAYPFFAGEIKLNKNSRIQVSKTATDFLPVAVLSGKVTLSHSLLSVKDISFQDLTLSTQRPYVHSGIFDINTDGNSKMSGFPIGFDSIHIGLSEGKVAIGAKVRLNFMNSSDKGFSGSTSFVITAAQQEQTQQVEVDHQMVTKTTTHWKLDKVTINDIALTVNVMAFKLKGIVTIFDNHPLFGNGFRGMLDFQVSELIPKAKATAYFGSKDDYRYWHVDAYIGVTIPIGPVIQITGMMGGMSYHMERPANFDPYQARDSVDKKGGMTQDLSEIFRYMPVKEAGLGFIGGVSLSFVQEVVVNVNVALEIQFGTDGGFRYAQFDGAGYCVHLPLKAKNNAEAGEDETAPVWVQFKMRYDNVNSTFDANFKTYINIAGILRGTNDRGLVGEAAFHVAPTDWWFYIGRPSQMFGLNIVGLAEIRTYFMMGTKVEDMPPLPAEVREVFDDVNTDFMAMENSMSTGRGFGFGAHFKVGFSFDFGVYGDFALGAGTDILLRNYGEARCKGSNSVIGFNGWYASGQAYVYVKGDVGIRVKVFGKKRGFSIASLSAAVLLQAKLPNPSWFRGMVGVKYRILGGLVSGKANIKIELGTQCEIVGAKELNVQVISDIKPDDQAQDVSVFATPQVAFNLAVGKSFSMLNEYDEVATYRISLDELKLLKDQQEIKGTTEINPDGTAASLVLRDILPPVSKLTAAAKVHIERQNGSSWEALKTSGNIDYETKSVSFTTGEAPDNIPWENVAYSYPVRRQYNFYPKEYGKGYIKLKRGQPYLFTATDNAGKKWKVTAAMAPVQGQPVNTNISYDESVAMVNFDIPATLNKETIYGFAIQRTSADGETSASNVQQKSTTVVGEDGDTTTYAQNTLKGVATSGLTKELISYNFRTSRYSTFVQKMNGTTNPYDLFDVATNYISVIGQRFDTDESFDKFEIEGDASVATKPLITMKAVTGNSWYQYSLLPLLYNGYPFHPSMTITRDPANGGIPPLDAIRLYNNDYSLYQLSDAAMKDGVAPSIPGKCRFMYYVSFYANDDFNELMNKATRFYINGGTPTPQISRLLNSTFPDLQGNQFYPVEFQYRLPGSNMTTSTITRSIYYKL